MVDAIHEKSETKRETSQIDVLETTGPHLYTNVVARNLHDLDYQLMDEGDDLYNGNVLYDGTKGCYHQTQRSQNIRYTKLF